MLKLRFDRYIRFSYKHCNFPCVCLLVKMVSKTVTRPFTVNSATRCHTLSQEGYSGFQVTGMIEGFFGGLKFSILVNLAHIFLGGLVYMQVGTFLGI